MKLIQDLFLFHSREALRVKLDFILKYFVDPAALYCSSINNLAKMSQERRGGDRQLLSLSAHHAQRGGHFFVSIYFVLINLVEQFVYALFTRKDSGFESGTLRSLERCS